MRNKKIKHYVNQNVCVWLKDGHFAGGKLEDCNSDEWEDKHGKKLEDGYYAIDFHVLGICRFKSENIKRIKKT